MTDWGGDILGLALAVKVEMKGGARIIGAPL